MTEAMPFLQKAILLSYDPRPLRPRGVFMGVYASALAEETAQQLQQGSAVEIAEHCCTSYVYFPCKDNVIVTDL